MPDDNVVILPDEAQRLTLVTEALDRRLRQEGRSVPRLAPDDDLIERGLVDSQALLDVILDVEKQSGYLFDAERIAFESGLTLRDLAAAFALE